MRLRRFLLASGAALAVGSCTDVSTNPEEVVSLAFDEVPAPGVVIGDTLRDTTGAVVPLTARAYNIRGEEIPDAGITYTAIERGLTIDAEGRVIGDSLRATAVRVVATTASGLQSAPRLIDIVLSPDSVHRISAENDTLKPGTSLTSRTSKPLQVRVLHLADAAAPADTMVRSYLVRFRIVHPEVEPGDVDRAHLVDAAGRPARVDTTDANGVAELRVRLGPCGIEAPPAELVPIGEACRPPITEPDYVDVEVTVVYKEGMPVRGSPVTIHLVVLPTAF